MGQALTEKIFVYVTCSNSEEAEKIATHLVTQKLVACANIMAPHKAVYRWQDKIESGAEVALILKTQESLFEKVRQAICAMHSYECPCIVALPIMAGHEPFLQWIEAQTAL